MEALAAKRGKSFRASRSALLGPTFNPAECLAKLCAAKQRPSPSRVLASDLQDREMTSFNGRIIGICDFMGFV